jgi:hypothetical protein
VKAQSGSRDMSDQLCLAAAAPESFRMKGRFARDRVCAAHSLTSCRFRRLIETCILRGDLN